MISPMAVNFCQPELWEHGRLFFGAILKFWRCVRPFFRLTCPSSTEHKKSTCWIQSQPTYHFVFIHMQNTVWLYNNLETGKWKMFSPGYFEKNHQYKQCQSNEIFNRFPVWICQLTHCLVLLICVRVSNHSFHIIGYGHQPNTRG